MVATLFLLLFLIPQALIFSFPARFSALKRRAMTSRQWRRGLIIGLGIVPTVVNLLIFAILYPIPETYFLYTYNSEYPEWAVDENGAIDEAIQDTVRSELRYRNFFFWRGQHCFTGDETMCREVSVWRTEQIQFFEEFPNSVTIDGMIQFLIIAFIVTLPSSLTAYFVYRITFDGSKKKASKAKS